MLTAGQCYAVAFDHAESNRTQARAKAGHGYMSCVELHAPSNSSAPVEPKPYSGGSLQGPTTRRRGGRGGVQRRDCSGTPLSSGSMAIPGMRNVQRSAIPKGEARGTTVRALLPPAWRPRALRPRRPINPRGHLWRDHTRAALTLERFEEWCDVGGVGDGHDGGDWVDFGPHRLPGIPECHEIRVRCNGTTASE